MALRTFRSIALLHPADGGGSGGAAGRGSGRGVEAVGVGLLVAVLAGCMTPGTPDGTPGPGAEPSSSLTPTPDEPTASPPGDAVVADLTVTVDVTGTGATQISTLTCGPAGGDHPGPQEACAAVAAVGPEVFEEPARDQMCTQQYGGPQVATIEGTVEGAAVRASFARTDGCEITRWDSLVPLLPEAGGA